MVLDILVIGLTSPRRLGPRSPPPWEHAALLFTRVFVVFALPTTPLDVLGTPGRNVVLVLRGRRRAARGQNGRVAPKQITVHIDSQQTRPTRARTRRTPALPPTGGHHKLNECNNKWLVTSSRMNYLKNIRTQTNGNLRRWNLRKKKSFIFSKLKSTAGRALVPQDVDSRKLEHEPFRYERNRPLSYFFFHIKLQCSSPPLKKITPPRLQAGFTSKKKKGNKWRQNRHDGIDSEEKGNGWLNRGNDFSKANEKTR
jgi:hypothetical protein